MRARARLALVVLTLLTAGLGSLGLVSPASAAVPKVGQCHQLTWSQALAASDSKAAVSCTARHNLQTIAVITASKSLAGMTLEQLAVEGDACLRPLYRTLSSSMTKRALTAYTLFTFAPTAEQRAAGARWIRCDLALAHDRAIAPLPRHKLSSPVVPTRIKDGIRRCLTGRQYLTTCTQPHAYRAVKAFVMDQAAYPTAARWHAAADRRCQTGWDLAYIATRAAWRAGQHTVTCYDKTRG